MTWDLVCSQIPENSRCSSCSYANIVPFQGPSNPNGDLHKILFIGEAPVEIEDAKKLPLISSAGQDFNQVYLPSGGLYRQDVAVTNVYKCRPPNNKTPSPSQIRACASHRLLWEIHYYNPRIIVALGGVALKFINMFSRANDPIDPPNLNIDSHHGFMFDRYFEDLDKAIQVFVTIHPAAGMRDGVRMSWALSDFKTLGKIVRGEELPAKTKEEKVKYKEISTIEEWNTFWPGIKDKPSLELGLDTEDDEDDRYLYSVQISFSEGKACFIDGRNSTLLSYVHRQISNNGWYIWLHHAAHDWDKVCAILKWDDIPTGNLRDTMQGAFHVGMSRELKAIAYQLCQVHMTSFHDLVYPYSISKVKDRLSYLSNHPDLQHLPVYGKKGQILKSKKITNPCKSDIDRILRYTTKSINEPDEDRKPYDPWDKFSNLVRGVKSSGDPVPEEKKKMIETLKEKGLLSIPRFSIRHVERSSAVIYGCRDADLTLRAGKELKKRADALDRVVGLGHSKKDWI